jgi:hypothetical protein
MVTNEQLDQKWNKIESTSVRVDDYEDSGGMLGVGGASSSNSVETTVSASDGSSGQIDKKKVAAGAAAVLAGVLILR